MKTAETVIRESHAFLKPIFEEIISGKYVAIDSVYESFANQPVFNNANSK